MSTVQTITAPASITISHEITTPPFIPITPTAIYFPIERIDVSYNKDDDKLEKDVIFCKKWKTLDKSDPHHPLVAIKTGHQSNITVIDFDRVSSYEKVLKAIPELAAVRTVKTRQGYHLYFTHEPQLKTVKDCFTVKDVDVRAEGGCILAPPTFYSYKDQVFRYEDLGGVVGPIPEALFEFMKPNAFKEAEVNAADAESYRNTVITEESCGATVDQVRHLVSLLSPQRAVSYTTWTEVGFAIHHVLDQEGLEIFIEFSKTGGKAYDQIGCIKFYRKLRHRYGSSLRMGSLCFWANQDNAAAYKAYKMAYPYTSPSSVESAASACESESASVEPKKAMRTVANDWEAGLLMYSELSKVLMYSSGSLYFKKDHIWIQNEGEIRSAIRTYVMGAALYKVNSKKECVPYSQQYKNACCIVQCVVDQAIAHQDNGWATTLYTSSYGYVLFTNGYWDFMGCRFVAMDSPEFDDSICFLEQIPFDYKEEMGAQNAARVQRALFLEPFGPRVAEYFIRQLARGLAGDAIKRFLVGIGPSNTGKSILTGALRSACGSYFGDWTGANLVDRHTSQDGGQQMRWLMLLRTKRIVVSNEIKTRQSLDSNTMKVMSSGGDDGITGREHGGNEQQGVTMRLLPILFAQDLPKISPIDDALSNRIRAIPYSKVYVDKPSNALELKKDPGLVADIKTEAFRMGLLHVLFDAYTRFHQGGQVEEEIDEIREAVSDVIGTELNIVDSFKLHFEITNDPSHFVSSKVIQAWLTDGKYNVTITKLGMELKRYIQINKFANVCNKNKKIDRKTVMVWHGIREFPEEE
jgi:hypothetical protein